MINLSKLKKENRRLQEKYDKLAKVCETLIGIHAIPKADSVEDIQTLEPYIELLRTTLELHKSH